MNTIRTKNKHGRVGVHRTRLTRAELKKENYRLGYRDGVMAEVNVSHTREHTLQKDLESIRKFMQGLLKMRNAAAIHEAVRNQLGS